jgi:hypothetical protein
MSFEDIHTALMARLPEAEGIEPSTMKLVLIAIAQDTNAKRGDHRAWPSFRRLALITGLALSAVSRAVEALDRIGAFKEHVCGNGRIRSEYVLDIAKLGNWGIDWEKEKAAVFSGRTQSSPEELRLPPEERVGSPEELRLPPEEQNKVLNLGFNTGLEAGIVTTPGSLRSPGAASPLPSTPVSKGKNQNRTPKDSGASSAWANQTPKTKTEGTRTEKPWSRSKPCPSCGGLMRRDENHACGAKAASANGEVLTESQKKFGNDLGVEPL